LLSNSISVTSSYRNSTYPIWIGGRSSSSTNFLPTDFKIRSIELKDKYLSATEIYNLTKGIYLNNSLRINSNNVELDTNGNVETAYNYYKSSLGNAYQDTAANMFAVSEDGSFESIDGNQWLISNAPYRRLFDNLTISGRINLTSFIYPSLSIIYSLCGDYVGFDNSYGIYFGFPVTIEQYSLLKKLLCHYNVLQTKDLMNTNLHRF